MKKQDREIELLKKIAFRLVRNWYLLMIMVGVAIGIAYTLIHYSTPVYKINSQIVTKKWNNSRTPLNDISGDAFFKKTPDIRQEIALIKSWGNVYQTIQSLDFEVRYFLEGKIRTTEVYRDKPFLVQFDRQSKVPYGVTFSCVYSDKREFFLETEEDKWKEFFGDTKFTFGKSYTHKGFTFSISKPKLLDQDNVKSKAFQLQSLSSLTTTYRRRLLVDWAWEKSAVLDISLISSIPRKDELFLRHFLKVVIERGLESKNEYANNTLDFIEQQVSQLQDTIGTFDQAIDQFKVQNFEFIEGSNLVFLSLKELNKEKFELGVKEKYLNYLRNYLNKNKDNEVFSPTTYPVDAPILEGLLESYLTLKLEREESDDTVPQANPMLGLFENNKKKKLELNILEQINNIELTIKERVQVINQKVGFMKNSLGDYQSTARVLTHLERRASLTDKTFNMLLEKQTELNLAKASTTSDYEVVNAPAINYAPISPDTKRMYMMALMIGFALPIGLFSLLELLNNKVRFKEDVEGATDLPILGMVSQSKNLEGSLVLLEQPKSFLAENFRGLRTSLQYFRGQDQSLAQTTLFTSWISGEGKSFCSINMALTLALSGKKTLLIGADLRRPRISEYMELPTSKGLSDYLAGFVELEEVLSPYSQPNLYLLQSGTVPPNPSELLVSDRLDALMQDLKQEFDCIIIDTPPIGLVADAFELFKYSDVNLIVVRQGVSFKDGLKAIQELKEQSKLSNAKILFNGVNMKKVGYGYGYYGYGNRAYGYDSSYYSDESNRKNKKWYSIKK